MAAEIVFFLILGMLWARSRHAMSRDRRSLFAWSNSEPSGAWMRHMNLRSYQNEDWGAVREIYDLSKPDEMCGVVEPGAIPPLESDQSMMALFRDSQITVAEECLRVIGFAGSRGAFVTWLFVHPAFRRKGVATALIREMLGRLGGPVTLTVVMTNIAALALYHRNGFTVESEFVGQFRGTSCKVARLRHEAAD